MSDNFDLNTWFREIFWPTYPKDLCQNKKGSKTVTWDKINKYKLSETECLTIMKNLNDHIRHDRAQINKGLEVDRWPLAQTYVNQRRFDDELEGDISGKATTTKLPECKKEGCTAEVHGQGYPFCGDHLPPPETPVLKLLREHYRDSGMMQREGESDRCHSLRLRKQYMKTMFNSLHPPIKPMDEFK